MIKNLKGFIDIEFIVALVIIAFFGLLIASTVEIRVTTTNEDIIGEVSSVYLPNGSKLED